MAKKDIIELLKKYIAILRAEGIFVEKAYLYGSHLSNTSNDESDIDIMIVSECEDDDTIGKIWSLTRKVNSKIEPYLIEKNRFKNDNNSQLINIVKSTGLEIC